MDDLFKKFFIAPSVLRRGLKAHGLKKDSKRITQNKNDKRFSTNVARYGEFNPGAFAVSPSKSEMEIYHILVKEFDLAVVQNDRTIIAPRELDLWIPAMNKAIEFNGNYWHDKDAWLKDCENDTYTTRERVKTLSCQQKNIVLYHIWEDEWLKMSSNLDKMNYLKNLLAIL